MVGKVIDDWNAKAVDIGEYPPLLWSMGSK